ncbi:hypothetical protein OIO90_000562 [Microbotryomycetes sp. JL221]|nr:hypothetical protein OIO90_000562 [Microbotryomycetes sp. JL221]
MSARDGSSANADELVRTSRPSQTHVLELWHKSLSHPLLSLSQLKQVAKQGQLPREGLRSLHWRYFFGLLPSPAVPTSTTYSTYKVVLSHSRAEYSSLCETYLRAPDGHWVNDGSSTLPLGRTSSSSPTSNGAGAAAAAPPAAAATTSKQLNVQVNNPLGLDDDNPWSTWFEDLELRRTIRQDVQRTFPELGYFRNVDVQDKLVNLLHIWCKLTPEIGYRQGMHELVAPLLWTVDFDSVDAGSPSMTESLPHLVLDRAHVEHDTWALFAALMKSCKVFYDFTPSVPLTTPAALSSTTNLTLAHNRAQVGGSAVVQPIVATAIRVHDSLLKIVDFELWQKLEELAIEPQLYAIRWLRLLFTREFPLEDALSLWDGVFAEDNSLRLVEYVCVAMLLRIRDAVLLSDYSGVLQLLLRYPTLRDGTHRVSLLLEQAIYLRDNTSSDAGRVCRNQNFENAAIAGVDDIAQLNGDSLQRRRSTSHVAVATTAAQRKTESPTGLLGEGGLGDLARGVYGRAEALGINKAFFGTLNEIKRGYAQAQAHNHAVTRPDGMSQIPLRFPWDPKPLPAAKDYLAEIGKMRATSIAMADAIDRCITVLQQEVVIGKPRRTSFTSNATTSQPLLDANTSDGDALPPSGETMMALTALSHIRDVLSGKARTFDQSVLSPLNHALASGVFPTTSSSVEEEPFRTSATEPSSSVSSLQTSDPARVHVSSSATLDRSRTSVSSSSSGPSTPPPPPLMLSNRHGEKPLPNLTRIPYPGEGLNLTTSQKGLPRVPSPSLSQPSGLNQAGIEGSTTEGTMVTEPLQSMSISPPPKVALVDPLGVSF